MSTFNKQASTAAPSEGAEGSDDIDAARRVLTLEAEALKALAESLGDRFVTALDILTAVQGRVVVSGMGKSGHIGRKIAATLASTGTPALYVHPGEASHGDLGMIAKEDVILVLSNSGNTPELADIVAYAKRFSIPLISITGPQGGPANPGRFLADAADVTLVLPPSPEACPMGLTPTTSTTAMLALGDALAIALLQRKEFVAEDFQVLHPGGRLGRTAIVRVADIMLTGDALPLVGEGTVMAEALIVMTEKSKGCVGVVDDQGRLAGIITDGDLRRHMKDRFLEQIASEVMSRAPRTIRPQALAAEALGLMNDSKITVLFVSEGKKPTGIVHMHDCLRAGIA